MAGVENTKVNTAVGKEENQQYPVAYHPIPRCVLKEETLSDGDQNERFDTVQHLKSYPPLPHGEIKEELEMNDNRDDIISNGEQLMTKQGRNRDQSNQDPAAKGDHQGSIALDGTERVPAAALVMEEPAAQTEREHDQPLVAYKPLPKSIIKEEEDEQTEDDHNERFFGEQQQPQQEENLTASVNREAEDAQNITLPAATSTSDYENITQRLRSTKRKRIEKNNMASTSAAPMMGSFDDLEGGQSAKMISNRRILRSNLERSGTSLGRHDEESSRKRKETTLIELNNEQQEEDTDNHEESEIEQASSSDDVDFDSSDEKSLENERHFSCKQCITEFRTKSYLQQHLIKYHGVKRSQLEKYGCQDSSDDSSDSTAVDKSSLPKKKATKRKRSSSIKKTRYAADDDSSSDGENIASGNSSAGSSSLKKKRGKIQHTSSTLSHGKEKAECAFRCETCGLRFTQKEAVRRHLDVECDFPCELCSHRFSRKDDLREHLKSVHKVKRSRLAKYGAGLKSEEASCSDQSPFKCPKCGRSYVQKRSMALHLKNECGVQPRFICNICDRKFKQKSSLKRHSLGVHKENDPS